MRRTLGCSLAALLVIASACAGGQRPEPPATRERRRCDLERTPSSLPPITDLADTTQLRRGISRITFTAPPAEQVLSLVIGPGGRPSTARFLDSSLTADQAADLRRVTLQSFRPQPTGDVWGIRFLITTGPSPSVTLDYAALCRPAVDMGSLNTMHPGGYRSRYRITREQVRDAMRRARYFRMAITIDHTGRVEDVSILRSLGSLRLDELTSEEVAWWRFHPMEIDGVAVGTILILDDLELRSLIGTIP